MDGASGGSVASCRAILDKPLSQLTEDDISQLTREDCRKFLKEKGSIFIFFFLPSFSVSVFALPFRTYFPAPGKGKLSRFLIIKLKFVEMCGHVSRQECVSHRGTNRRRSSRSFRLKLLWKTLTIPTLVVMFIKSLSQLRTMFRFWYNH